MAMTEEERQERARKAGTAYRDKTPPDVRKANASRAGRGSHRPSVLAKRIRAGWDDTPVEERRLVLNELDGLTEE